MKMPEEKPTVGYTLRMPRPLFEGLRRRHAETYPAHRMSMNRWLVHKLERWAKHYEKQA